ncbi:MAG: hypothetical protein WDM79_03885 [Terricaulis sp.]
MTSRLSRHLTLGLAASALFAAAPAQADDGRWSFSTGADYTSGDYGEATDTTILIVPFTAAYGSDRWRASVSVPYVRLEGTGNIIPGTGAGGASGGGSSGGLAGVGGGLLPGLFPGATPTTPSPTPTPTPVTIEEEGVGDATLSLSVTPYIADSGARFTIAADARVPTGDEERSLGAGETIGSIATGYSHPIGERSALYGSIGYQRAFDSGQDSIFANLGAESLVTEKVLLGASVDWSEASVDGRPNASQASLYTGFLANDHVRLVAYASAGLSETSPDTGAGVRLVLRP